MKKILIFGILFIALLLFLVFGNNSTSPAKTKILTINNHQLVAEVADTDGLRSDGLSGRSSMPKEHGMLFIFPVSSYYRFWMKEMKFPLDFIWIDKDLVVDVTENVPAPKTKNISELQTFTSRFPFNQVLEANAGTVKSFDIHVGDKIK